jgi:hypothetical protein
MSDIPRMEVEQPEWANWLAMDNDGVWYWYSYQPTWDDWVDEWKLLDADIDGRYTFAGVTHKLDLTKYGTIYYVGKQEKRMNFNEMTIKELINLLGDSEDPTGALFKLLLKHEMESADYAVSWCMDRVSKETDDRLHNFNSDLVDALQVLSAFHTLLDYYSVPGEVE